MKSRGSLTWRWSLRDLRERWKQVTPHVRTLWPPVEAQRRRTIRRLRSARLPVGDPARALERELRHVWTLIDRQLLAAEAGSVCSSTLAELGARSGQPSSCDGSSSDSGMRCTHGAVRNT